MRLRSAAFEATSDEIDRLRALGLARGIVLERPGAGLYCFGEAARLELPEGLSEKAGRTAVAEALRRTSAGSEDTAVSPLAVGALPFLPDAPSSLRVPEVSLMVGSSSGAPVGRLICVAERPSREMVDDLMEIEPGAAEAGDPPDEFELRSARPHSDYLQRVRAAVEEIEAGRLTKIVLAREVVVTANRPLRQGDLVERLRSLHPSCATFAVEGFIGATPELLVRKKGDRVESFPLAGTAARSGDAEADKLLEAALLSSAKERSEHRAVVDAIAQGLQTFTTTLDVPDTPTLVELRNVSHLGTFLSGRLAAPEASSLELLAAIHPTPAVAGTPGAVALEYLQKLEDLDRDRYAGAVGWMDASGDGEWYLGIRSAVVDGLTARLLAGSGIVADSDPVAELRETQLKLQAMLAAAVRP